MLSILRVKSSVVIGVFFEQPIPIKKRRIRYRIEVVCLILRKKLKNEMIFLKYRIIYIKMFKHASMLYFRIRYSLRIIKLKSGFTLTEVLVSMAFLAIISLAIAGASNSFLVNKSKLVLNITSDALEAKLRQAMVSKDILYLSVANNTYLSNCLKMENCLTTTQNQPFILRTASGVLFPDPNGASNNCVSEDGVSVCTCGSTSTCRWKIVVTYSILSQSEIQLTGLVQYQKGTTGAIISDKKIVVDVSGNNFSITPSRTATTYPCLNAQGLPDPKTTILLGYNIDGTPNCQNVTLICPEGKYISGTNANGSYICTQL